MAKVVRIPGYLPWMFLHPQMTIEHLGYIPFYFPVVDNQPDAETLMRQGYTRSAGCAADDFFNQPGHQFTMQPDGTLQYPGDPELAPLAFAMWGDEELFFYPHALFAIRQPDGSHKVWRLD